MRQPGDEGFDSVRGHLYTGTDAEIDGTLLRVDALIATNADPSERMLILDRHGRETIYGEVRFAQECRREEHTNRLEWIPNTRKAVKIFCRERIQRLNIAEDHVSEFNLQLRFSRENKHPNVMPLDVIYTTDKHIYAVMPFAAGGELFDLVSAQGPPMSEASVRQLFHGMVSGVDHLHRFGVAHRDVSLENYTLQSTSPPFNPLLIDFGLAFELRPNEELQAGTPQKRWEDIAYTSPFGKPNYISPEFFLITQLRKRNKWNQYAYSGPAQDVWALGVCLFMLAFRARPWTIPYSADPDYNLMVYSKVKQSNGAVAGLHAWMLDKGWVFDADQRVYMKGERKFSAGFVELLQLILRQEPDTRPTTAEILEHPWLANGYE